MRRLTRFFATEAEEGRLEGDPELLTRVMIGSIHHFTFAEIHGFNQFFSMTRDQFVSGVVDLLLGPPAGASSRSQHGEES